MKGVILAGGTGSRLHPLTRITNKHLLPVYDKPMIFYPIETLVSAGIDEIMVVTGGNHAGEFLPLLGNGSEFGLHRLQFSYQAQAGGIAEALGLCESFVDGDKVVVMLGDNILGLSIATYVQNFVKQARGGRLLLKEMEDPSHLRHLGVPIFGKDDRLTYIREKPETPPSPYAVIGIYMYDPGVFEIVRSLKPSGRGELEITDVNNAYVDRGLMEYDVIDGYWGDAGESIDVYYSVVDYVRAHGANLDPARPANEAQATSEIPEWLGNPGRRRGGLMRILVTGGAGFIGSEFVRQTLLAWHPADEVTVLDKLTYAGNLANLEPVADHRGYRFVHGDIADRTVVEQAVAGCQAVVNFAAETHVDRSILEPDAFVKTDVLGTWTLAEAARAAGVTRFLQVSTDEVYGAVLDGASLESDRLDPTSPYSAAKAGGELLVLAAHKTYGLPALVVRGANAFGPYQYPEKVIPLHITNAIDDQPLPVYGDGQQRRQWTHVTDFCSGIDTVLRQGTIGEIYNIGNPQAEAELPVNLELSRRVLELLGKPSSLLEFVVDRPAHDRRYRVDSSKLLGLGWQPAWRFGEGLEATVEWYAEHQEWWRPIKSGARHQAYYEQNYADRSSFARQ